MNRPYSPPGAPPRTELTHHLLVRAAAGLIALRHDPPGGRTVLVDGDPAPLVYAVAVSDFDARGWLVWWRDTADPTLSCCCLNFAGDEVLRAWDAELCKAATA